MTRKDHFKRFDDHTLVKHFLLGAYLKRWAIILLRTSARTGNPKRIWFVDAFAGAGGDESGRPGSPVIAAQIARDVNAEVFPAGITNESGMRVICFETDDDYFGLLESAMRQFTASVPPVAFLRHVSLDKRIDAVVDHFNQDPALGGHPKTGHSWTLQNRPLAGASETG